MDFWNLGLKDRPSSLLRGYSRNEEMIYFFNASRPTSLNQSCQVTWSHTLLTKNTEM